MHHIAVTNDKPKERSSCLVDTLIDDCCKCFLKYDLIEAELIIKINPDCVSIQFYNYFLNKLDSIK